MLLFAFIIMFAAGEPTLVAKPTIEGCLELRLAVIEQADTDTRIGACVPVVVIPQEKGSKT